MLTVAVFTPLAGAIALLFLPGDRPRLLRAVALGVSVVPLILLAVAWRHF